jgi:hypothetical protein
LVSGYKLAEHFGVVRQTVDALTSQGVLTRRALACDLPSFFGPRLT